MGRRLSTTLMIVGAVALVGLLATLGWILVSSPGSKPVSIGDVPIAPPTVTFATTADPTATASPTPAKTTPSRTPSPRKTSRKPSPTPTVKPPKASLPPNPKPSPTKTAGCPTLTGPTAAPGDVRSALHSAGSVEYWQKLATSELDPNLNGQLPTITIPDDLMDAIAFQESSWRSTVVSCDGGRGLMQVMTYTRDWANAKFHTSYDIDTMSGNAAIGAEYLEWSRLYFGLYYFGSYDWDATAPVGAGGATMKLRDVVIASYNVGAATLENGDTLSIPNQDYVDKVTGYLANCPCSSM
jgi:hypothetical protein